MLYCTIAFCNIQILSLSCDNITKFILFFQNAASNACTLICIWFAYYLSVQNGFLDVTDKSDFHKLVFIIFTAIRMGNEAHKKMIKYDVLKHPYYVTINQALQYGGSKVQCLREVV